MAHHPAEFFLKYLIVREPGITDDGLAYNMGQLSILRPTESMPDYLPLLRQNIPPPPPGFDATDKRNRATVEYLRYLQIYEFFWPNAAMNEAWEILIDPEKRLMIEKALLARCDMKLLLPRINKKHFWKLTVAGVDMFRHCFWNIKLLTLDEWGAFLYGRSTMYEQALALLQGTPQLAMYLLRLEQTVESQRMIRRAQEIAYFTLEEVAQTPGARQDKVKSIGILTKAITECHEALSTSDMALKDVIKNFERFQMMHPASAPKSIHEVAPNGNFTGSGLALPEPKKN